MLDRNENVIGQSEAVDKLFDWSVISPRLGATFKLNEAGTTLLKGSWGRYYRGIVTGEFDNATPSIAAQVSSSRASTTPRAIRSARSSSPTTPTCASILASRTPIPTSSS